MKRQTIGMVGVVVLAMLGACAQPPPQQFSVQRPDEQKPQTITFPNGTVFGGASGSQASPLAQLVVDSNNNNMKEYEELQGNRWQESANLPASAAHARTPVAAARHRRYYAVLSNRLCHVASKWFAISTAHQFPGLPLP
jgi:hypothetical protein